MAAGCSNNTRMAWLSAVVLGWVLVAAAGVEGSEDQWATDPELLRAVEANGLGGCTLQTWDPRQKTRGTLPEGAGPLLIPEGAVQWSAAPSQAQWERPAFLDAHGSSGAEVRLPGGQRQSGLVVRRATVERLSRAQVASVASPPASCMAASRRCAASGTALMMSSAVMFCSWSASVWSQAKR